MSDEANSGDVTIGVPGPKGSLEHPRQIGAYKILGLLGEGGFGVVYNAEQEKPLRRRVALKVIKLGMDTREVVARFESERQALALMDHPNIARVYDAGATEDGRPYFVMEQVPGVALTEFCDRHRLTIADRLTIFLQVCEGIEHAHHRGIIHRDLKPSNILVSMPDDKPVATIIDFGVARATNHRLTEKTVYTEIGRAIGTPAYMSPEQAEMTAEVVDHRTDIYSLGAILYELLVGELPLSGSELEKAAFDEVIRRIREDEPPTPSTRWSRLNIERTEKLAIHRNGSSGAILTSLRGDLDWIVMKAMEKDRNRRYPTASDLGADLRRYLQDEPILARPPGIAYRTRKYLRKNRGPVLAVSLIVGVLIAGLVASTALFFKMRGARDREMERVEERDAAVSIAEARVEERDDALKLAESRLEEIGRLSDRLSDGIRLNKLRTEAAFFAHGLPDLAKLEKWLEESRELTARIPDHERAMRDLQEEHALPRDQEAIEQDRANQPKRPQLDRLRERHERLVSKVVPTDRQEEDGQDVDATRVSYGTDPLHKPVSYRFRRTFLAEGHEKLGILHTIEDGAVIYINGDEVSRVNMRQLPSPQGTLAHEGRAQLGSLEPGSVEWQGGLFRGRNVIAVDVRLSSPRSTTLLFDLAVVDQDSPLERYLIAPGDTWRHDDPERPARDGWQALDFDDSDWKTARGPFGFGFRDVRGLVRDRVRATSSLLQEIASLQAQISLLENEIDSYRSWRFSQREMTWHHEALADLIRNLREFSPDHESGVFAQVKSRYDRLRGLHERSVVRHKENWDRARESIRNLRECPEYRGLDLEPQLGLVPIGRSEQGLWEFALLDTGAVPDDAEGIDPELEPELAVILVLLPDGEFSMGAAGPRAIRSGETRNPDPNARSNEGPITDIRLSAFFVSKYEVTQYQWLRMADDSPSAGDSGPEFPVDSVNWDEARRGLATVGLDLPTEAQWEYAARAHSKTVWWTGNDELEVEDAANVDGGGVMEIGAYDPNGFGLHDVIGNVWEWCRDDFVDYTVSPRPGDGARSISRGEIRVIRGGSFEENPLYARSAARAALAPDTRAIHVGFRAVRELRR